MSKHYGGGNGKPLGDAAADAIGTVRRSPDGRILAIQWPSRPNPYTWAVSDGTGSLGYETPDRVKHWPIVGVVPYSPAAGVPLDGSAPTGRPLRGVTTVPEPVLAVEEPPR